MNKREQRIEQRGSLKASEEELLPEVRSAPEDIALLK